MPRWAPISSANCVRSHAMVVSSKLSVIPEVLLHALKRQVVGVERISRRDLLPAVLLRRLGVGQDAAELLVEPRQLEDVLVDAAQHVAAGVQLIHALVGGEAELEEVEG